MNKIDWSSLAKAIGSVIFLIAGFVLYIFLLINHPVPTLVCIGIGGFGGMVYLFYLAFRSSKNG